MWVCREDTKVLKRNPPEKGEETGIAMDNMKPSGSCPEKIEVVVVVVVVLGFLLRSTNYNKETPAATTPL